MLRSQALTEQRSASEAVCYDAQILVSGEGNSCQAASQFSGTDSARDNNSCCHTASNTLSQECFTCSRSFNPHNLPRSDSRRKLRFKGLATPKGTQVPSKHQKWTRNLVPSFRANAGRPRHSQSSVLAVDRWWGVGRRSIL